MNFQTAPEGILFYGPNPVWGLDGGRICVRKIENRIIVENGGSGYCEKSRCEFEGNEAEEAFNSWAEQIRTQQEKSSK